MFETLAFAQADGAPQGGSPLGAFLPLILIFVIFYFLLIRPQQKRQKQHQQMLSSLKSGDEVITSGGVYGTITQVLDQNTFMIEIAKGTTIKVARNGIATKATPQSTEEKK